MAPPFGRGFPRGGPLTVIGQAGAGFGGPQANARGFGTAGGAPPPPIVALSNHSMVLPNIPAIPVLTFESFISVEFGSSNSVGNLWQRGELVVHWGRRAAGLDSWETDFPTLEIDGIARPSLGPGPPFGGDNVNVVAAYGAQGNVVTSGLFSFHPPEWHIALPVLFADLANFDARLDVISNVPDPLAALPPSLATTLAGGFGAWSNMAQFGPLNCIAYVPNGAAGQDGLGTAVIHLSIRDAATLTVLDQCDLTFGLHHP